MVECDICCYLFNIEKLIKNCNVCQIVYKGKIWLINFYKFINKKNIWYL